MRHLRPADYTVSDWSGGRTVQLSIGPEGEQYADRKFLWRISSATVELETSEFTALPDYERLIAPIRGEMILSHNGGEEILLRPFDVHRFDGADLTVSKGKCTDFNLMLRKGQVTGEMRAIRLGSGGQRKARNRDCANSGFYDPLPQAGGRSKGRVGNLRISGRTPGRLSVPV